MAVKRIRADEVLSRFLASLDLTQDQYVIEAGGRRLPAWCHPGSLRARTRAGRRPSGC